MGQIRHSASFSMNEPAEKLFPLFSAEGEKLWVPGWDFENITGSPELHEDYVFVTKNHDHGSTDAIWLVKKYEPHNYNVQFYKIEPGDKIGIITVACRQMDASHTRVEVVYEYVGLSPKGDRFIEGFTKAKYEEFIGGWKTLLDNYFDQNSA